MKKSGLVLSLSLLVSGSVLAKDRFADVQIKAQQVNGNVYVLYGAGGNIGVLADRDGSLMVDDQFEPLAFKIEQAIQQLSQETGKISYVVNTHYHGDHTGSNPYFSKSASILAHENVRKRLANKSTTGLPVITYEQGVKLHLGDETVHVKHLAKGHTDGDSVVYFQQANVWHLGDLFFESRFPYVDLDSGGSVQGYINNLQSLLTMISDDAKIIPGHGELTNKASLERSLAMMEATFSYVKGLKQQGLSLDQVLEKGLNSKWSDWGWRFITEKKWLTTLYNDS